MNFEPGEFPYQLKISDIKTVSISAIRSGTLETIEFEKLQFIGSISDSIFIFLRLHQNGTISFYFGRDHPILWELYS